MGWRGREGEEGLEKEGEEGRGRGEGGRGGEGVGGFPWFCVFFKKKFEGGGRGTKMLLVFFLGEGEEGLSIQVVQMFSCVFEVSGVGVFRGSRFSREFWWF